MVPIGTSIRILQNNEAENMKIPKIWTSGSSRRSANECAIDPGHSLEMCLAYDTAAQCRLLWEWFRRLPVSQEHRDQAQA